MKTMKNWMNKTFAVIMTLVLALVAVTGAVATAEKDSSVDVIDQSELEVVETTVDKNVVEDTAEAEIEVEDITEEESIEEDANAEEPVEENTEDVIVEDTEEEPIEEDANAEEPVEENTEDIIVEDTEDTNEEEIVEDTTEEELVDDAEEQTEVENEEEPVIDVSKLKVEIETTLDDVAAENEIITLTSKLTGFEGLTYQLQWQCNDGTGWKDVEGATGETYSFTADEESVSLQWRLMVTL